MTISLPSQTSPGPTFVALVDLIGSGDISDSVLSSLYRVGTGLVWGFAIGVPIGVLIGYLTIAMRVANVPFQFLRMISPLVDADSCLAFETWDSAIIFLIVMATVWPIMFSTSHGVKRIDPDWFKVARNLGASSTQMVRTIILPAIMADVMAGVQLAVGVAWVVLVPAEYLGVTSGLGYAINDARDTLAYDTLAAMSDNWGYRLHPRFSCARLVIRFNWHQEA